jgi:hypothetical protein
MDRKDSSPHKLQAHLKRLWVHGFLMGSGVVSVILLTLFFIWGWPSLAPEWPEERTSTLSQAPSAPATPESKPAPIMASMVGPTSALRIELEKVLANMAEANLKKDLPQLLSLYDPTFLDLSVKTKEISRSWTAYDYRSLRFRIEEIKSATPGAAVARVVWQGKTRNRATGELKDFSRIYQVGFSNDSGQWRIKHLKKGGI